MVGFLRLRGEPMTGRSNAMFCIQLGLLKRCAFLPASICAKTVTRPRLGPVVVNGKGLYELCGVPFEDYSRRATSGSCVYWRLSAYGLARPPQMQNPVCIAVLRGHCDAQWSTYCTLCTPAVGCALSQLVVGWPRTTAGRLYTDMTADCSRTRGM